MAGVLGLFRNAPGEVRKAGERVFAEGEPATCMYVVRSGEIGVYVGDRLVERVEAGGLVGELALLDDGPRSATAMVLTDCELVPVDQPRFLFMLRETPFFAIEVMGIMANRLRAMNRLAEGGS
jgi:CRP/FNR family transcriptional regulator, cyclic AMP receptor protein